MEDEKRYTIRLDPRLLEAIKRYAQEDKRSINSEFVWILQDYEQARERRSHAQDVQVQNLSKQDD
jgi:hypothetical protein